MKCHARILSVCLCIVSWDAAHAQTTSKASVGSSGAQGNGVSRQAVISGNGRFITFESLATNFVAGDTNGGSDVFVRDRTTGTTGLVSANPGGVPGNNFSELSTLSADGRFVAFDSFASDLVAGDAN